MNLGEFQIRGALGDHPRLRIREKPDGELVLSEEGRDVLNLGDPEDALLVAKCIEVAARWEVSEEYEEASRAALQETLEQVRKQHAALKP